MAVVAGVLGKAGQRGKQRRLQDASKGNVSWNTPPELVRHMQKEVKMAIANRKEVMGRMQSNVQGFTEEEQKLMRLGNKDVDVEISEDDMVKMLGETALNDATDAAVKAGDVPLPKEQSRGKVGSQLADIEAQLQRVQQQTTHIELAVGGTQK